MNTAIKAAFVAISVTSLAGPVLADQQARSGTPLEIYCNTAPEFGTARSDAVDNWVRICSVWLEKKCQASTPSLEDIQARQDAARNR